MRCLALAAVAALGAMACATAFADATASATLSDLKVTLTDLTPGDGIDPSVTFTPYNRAYSAVALSGVGQLLCPARRRTSGRTASPSSINDAGIGSGIASK